MAGIAIALLAGLSGAACTLSPADAVALSERAVRIRDVVTLSCISPEQRDRVGAMELARLPPEVEAVTLSRAAITALARRRAPQLRALSEPGEESTMTLRLRRDTPTLEQTSCYVATRTLARGAAVRAGDLAPGACATTSDVFIYDRRARVLRTTAPLSPGEPVGALAVLPRADFVAGDTLRLSRSSGLVRVERNVVALQAAPADASLFVRGEDGEIFALSPRKSGAPP
jgi:hypothetical protein